MPAIAALAALIPVLLAGCPFRRGPQGSLEQLAVVTYRVAIDESADTVSLVGIVRNTGEQRTPAGELVVTLRSRTGSLKGQNRVAVAPLEAGEDRPFDLEITAHGSVEGVEIAIVEPGEVAAAEQAEGGDMSPAAEEAE
ncbi:MAG: hypothetical protein ACP5KN_10735 [Armatimonadota bacterium]